MLFKTLLNRVHPAKGFVYDKVQPAADPSPAGRDSTRRDDAAAASQPGRLIRMRAAWCDL